MSLRIRISSSSHARDKKETRTRPSRLFSRSCKIHSWLTRTSQSCKNHSGLTRSSNHCHPCRPCRRMPRNSPCLIPKNPSHGITWLIRSSSSTHLPLKRRLRSKLLLLLDRKTLKRKKMKKMHPKESVMVSVNRPRWRVRTGQFSEESYIKPAMNSQQTSSRTQNSKSWVPQTRPST